MELPNLPTEIINLIMYKFKGLQTPSAYVIEKHWVNMKKEYRVFDDLVIEESRHIMLNENEDNRIVIGSITNMVFVPRDYPRIFFQ
jgi:hypothetical protein